MNYPASIARDPYWSEDLAEALTNKPRFIEPGDDVNYEDYRYVGAHNAFVYNRFYEVVRQQDQTILGQLTYGVRGLMLDTYDWPSPTTDTKVGSGSVALSHGGFGDGTRLQKGTWNTEFQTLKYELRRVVEFMKANPKAVITIILEDYADPARTSAAVGGVVIEAGLAAGALLFTPADYRSAGNSFPTLGWMRTHNKRLLVFSQNAAETANVFHEFDHFFENAYGTSDERALCSERSESAASKAAGRKLVAFNHFPGPGQGSGVTPTTEMQKWRVEYGTAEAIMLKAKRAGFAGGRTFNGYWVDRVIDCSNHLEEEGDLTVFEYVNDLNTGHDLRLVEEGRGYHITSAAARNYHLAKYEGSYATAGKTAVSHRLQTAAAVRPELIADKAKVYLRTTAPGAGANDYLNAEDQFNLWYSGKAGTDEEWTVMRVDPRNTGPLRFGETVRFKSRRQSEDARAPRYLSRESDNYLGTRGEKDADPKNKGIDWIIEAEKRPVVRRRSKVRVPPPPIR
jgi:hypothetical protein